MEQKYEKYSSRFKKQLVFWLIASILGTLSCILLVFTPMFNRLIDGVLVPKYSLFDRILSIIKGEGGYLSILIIFACIYLLVAIVILAKDVFTKIKQLKDFDKYCLLAYDEIVHRSDTNTRTTSQKDSMRSPISWAWSGVIEVLFVEFFLYGWSLSFFSRISIYGILTIIVFIGTVVFDMVAKNIYEKIKKEIITGEYADKNSTTPQQPVTNVAPIVEQSTSVAKTESNVEGEVAPTVEGSEVKRFCSNCGAQLAPDSKFCSSCGKQQ